MFGDQSQLRYNEDMRLVEKEFVVIAFFFVFCYLLIHLSFGGFRELGVFDDRWLECTLRSL